MGIKVIGSITVETHDTDNQALEQIVIPAEEFGIEEDGNRHIGDGDYQYEVLYMYFDSEERFEISFQATEFGNNVSCYPISIEGDVKIIKDNISIELVESDFDDD